MDNRFPTREFFSTMPPNARMSLAFCDELRTRSEMLAARAELRAIGEQLGGHSIEYSWTDGEKLTEPVIPNEKSYPEALRS